MLQNTDQNIEENTLISEALTHANLINSPQLNFDKKKVNFLYNFVKDHNINKVQFIFYFIGIALIIYFLLTTIFGDKGLFFYKSLKTQVQNKEFVKRDLINKMRTKKSMVEGMNLESLDLDLVDEQSRKVLGYVGKSEVVIYQDKNDQKDESN
jgi:cell division protein FtsB